MFTCSSQLSLQLYFLRYSPRQDGSPVLEEMRVYPVRNWVMHYTDVSRAVAKPVVWSKLLNHTTRSRAQQQWLISMQHAQYVLLSVVLVTGLELHAFTLATCLYVLLMSIHTPIYVCSTTTNLYIYSYTFNVHTASKVYHVISILGLTCLSATSSSTHSLLMTVARLVELLRRAISYNANCV